MTSFLPLAMPINKIYLFCESYYYLLLIVTNDHNTFIFNYSRSIQCFLLNNIFNLFLFPNDSGSYYLTIDPDKFGYGVHNESGY